MANILIFLANKGGISPTVVLSGGEGGPDPPPGPPLAETLTCALNLSRTQSVKMPSMRNLRFIIPYKKRKIL